MIWIDRRIQSERTRRSRSNKCRHSDRIRAPRGSSGPIIFRGGNEIEAHRDQMTTGTASVHSAAAPGFAPAISTTVRKNCDLRHRASVPPKGRSPHTVRRITATEANEA